MLTYPSPEAAFGTHWDVFLISGSRVQGEQAVASLMPLAPVLIRLTEPRGRFGNETFTWRKVTHGEMGGVTNATLLIGRQSLPELPFTKGVRRSLGHILEYHHPCKAVPALVDGSTYSEQSHLRTKFCNTPIVYPTYRSCTGVGKRSLVLSELASAFDLPVWLSPAAKTNWHELYLADGMSTTFPPLKLSIRPIEALVALLETSDAPCRSAQHRPTASSSLARTGDSTYFADIDRSLSGAWIDEGLVSAKAVKDDDAAAPSHLWDERLLGLFPWVCTKSQSPHTAFEIIRRSAFGWWCHRLFKSAQLYLRATYGNGWMSQVLGRTTDTNFLGPFLAEMVQVCGGDAPRGAALMNRVLPFWLGGGRDRRDKGREGELIDASAPRTLRDEMAHIAKVLHQNTSRSWWAWDRGSRLVFWRWNGKQQQHDALHGLKIFVKGSLPQYTTKARPPKPSAKAEVQTKLGKVIDRSYIDVGHVKSLINYFAVPKGPTDIQLRPQRGALGS
ncbi:hypothetical protein ACA910_002957 [Epithemia clementina (nom. ined.)]